MGKRVVFATAKILIWKQFTTECIDDMGFKSCVCNCKDTNLKAIHNLMVTRKNWHIVVFATAKILIWKQFTTSSQRCRALTCCVCNCKDTNLKAIHNRLCRLCSLLLVVFATAKILIWKQFTTGYKEKLTYCSCVCNCKDTNLKAIHNTHVCHCKNYQVVFATAKILIWKQFTTESV